MNVRFRGYGRALTLTEILEQLQPKATPSTPPPSSTPPPGKAQGGFNFLPIILGAGAGFLVGGPVGALVGGGAVALASKK